MDNFKRSLLNSIKCPICKSQIDLLTWNGRSDGRKYNYSCVNNWEHYRLLLIDFSPISLIKYEAVVVYIDSFRYEITQFDDDTTEIKTSIIDAEGRILEQKTKIPTIKRDKKMFDFSNLTEDKLLNRLKTILVFQ